jgi:multiple sugar transport system permease protein
MNRREGEKCMSTLELKREHAAKARHIRYHVVEKTKKWSWILFRNALIIGICFVILYPILLKLSIAFKHRIDIYDLTVVWLPKHLTMDNLKTVNGIISYFQSLKNTLTISVLTTALQTVSCALAGYGFARLKFKGSGILFALVIFTIIVPPQTLMISTYLHYRYFDVLGLVEFFAGTKGVNLLNSYWPFVISSLTAMGLKNGLYIYIFRQFFRALPKELEEAAYVDGCGVFQTFFKIMLPNAVPAIVTVILFSFVWQWNDIFYVSLFVADMKVLSTQLLILPSTMRLVTMDDPAYGSMLLNTGVLMMIAPIVILYLFVQKYFVESVERTGIVG